MTGLLHLVLFRFRPGASAADRGDLERRMLALAGTTRDGRHYVRAVRGGANTSPEGAGHGYDLGFVVEFEDAADRAYYLGPPHADEPGDPAHAAFTAFAGPLVEDVLVFDVEV